MDRKKFTTTLDNDLINRIKIQAINENIAVSKLIEKLFEEYLKSKEV